MAIPPTTEEAFLREVDDGLRQDQLTSVWKRYGRWIIAAVIVGLALFGAALWWQNDQLEKAGVDGEKLDKVLQATNDGSYASSVADLAALKSSKSDGYRASSQLTAAAIALEKKDLKEAAKLYGAVATDETLAQPWRDLALVRQVATSFDTMKPEEVIARLKPLAIKGNPWFGSAGEMVAIAYMKLGKNDLAGKMFGDMSKDEQVPESIRSRAIKMAGVLGVDVVDMNNKGESK
ncbi:MAG: tetratricopeptide repeat protein [Chakrabartia sp.]